MKIKSCAHCGGKPEKVNHKVTSGELVVVGWECGMCRADITVCCVKDMVDYNLRKMGMQWNMRVEVKEENYVEY